MHSRSFRSSACQRNRERTPRVKLKEPGKQMIDAKGGRGNLYRIETMVQETRDYSIYLYPIFAHGKEHTVKVYAFPNGEWRWETAPIFGDKVQAADLIAGAGYIGYPNNDIRKTSSQMGEGRSQKYPTGLFQ